MKYATTGIVMAMLAFAGCEKNDSSTASTPNEVAPSTSKAASAEATRTAAHESVVSEWRRQLDVIKTKVQDMKVRAVMASADVKTDFDAAVKSMDQQANEIQSRLDGFKESAGASWDTFKSDIKAKMARLESDASDATDKYMRGPTNPEPANPSTPPAPPPSTPPVPSPDTPPKLDAPPSPDSPPADPSNPK